MRVLGQATGTEVTDGEPAIDLQRSGSALVLDSTDFGAAMRAGVEDPLALVGFAEASFAMEPLEPAPPPPPTQLQIVETPVAYQFFGPVLLILNYQTQGQREECSLRREHASEFGFHADVTVLEPEALKRDPLLVERYLATRGYSLVIEVCPGGKEQSILKNLGALSHAPPMCTFADSVGLREILSSPHAWSEYKHRWRPFLPASSEDIIGDMNQERAALRESPLHREIKSIKLTPNRNFSPPLWGGEKLRLDFCI